MTSTPTQAQLFAAEYARNAGAELLSTVKQVGRKAGRITKIALGVSMPHQIGFLVGLAPLTWHTPREILQSVTVVSGSVLVPVAVDYLIMTCVQVITTRAVIASARKLALRLMIFPVLLSALVNVIAPGPWLLRGLFGAIVLFVPMAEGLRAAIKPDFKQVEAAETEIAAQVAPTPTPGRTCEPGCGCGKHTRKPAARKSPTRPRTRKPAAPKPATLEQIMAGLPDAPVSPAPVGLTTSSGLYVARTLDEALNA
jgi:hypothetical protein